MMEKKDFTMKVTIIIDNPSSWFVSYGMTLRDKLDALGHDSKLVHAYEDISEGDCLFLLSCTSIVEREVLLRNSHNIVIHASALPKGQGFSPLTYQILEGLSTIPITLFEAVEKVDSGPIYITDTLTFEGHELREELDRVLGEKIVEMALRYIAEYPGTGRPQVGESSWYKRRKPEHSELDPHKSIVDQFNLLRVVDNERYPAFFKHKGHTYTLKIEKKKSEG